MGNLKYDTTQLIYKTDTDIGNRLLVDKGERVGEGKVGGLKLADAN